jgi:uncharacterized membrane protein
MVGLSMGQIVSLGVKTSIDAAVALQLANQEWQENRAFCAYCQMATLCSLASVALAVPEIVTAIDTLLGKESQAIL